MVVVRAWNNIDIVDVSRGFLRNIFSTTNCRGGGIAYHTITFCAAFSVAPAMAMALRSPRHPRHLQPLPPRYGQCVAPFRTVARLPTSNLGAITFSFSYLNSSLAAAAIPNGGADPRITEICMVSAGSD